MGCNQINIQNNMLLVKLKSQGKCQIPYSGSTNERNTIWNQIFTELCILEGT